MGDILTVHVRNYGDQLVEVGWNHRRRPDPGERARRGESEHQEDNRTRAINRARLQVVRKILANRLDHLVTLSYRENVTDLARAKEDLRAFCERVQEAVPGWRYLVVWERQKRGAWHFHLAVQGRQDTKLLWRTWWAVVGENQGGVDVQETKARKAKNKRAAIARYMGKYLGKDLESWELNKKNYWHSKNVQDQAAVEIPIVLDANVSIWEAVEDVIQGQGAPGIARRWSDLCARSGWAASW